MTRSLHFHLKQPTGWFAAGREIQHALIVLSDPAFKLFLWLCLNAERSRGSLIAPIPELASALHKTEPEIQTALDELFQKCVCYSTDDGMIEIADRFWPYHRNPKPSATKDLALYIAHVKHCFLERRCVQSAFTPADEKLAARLHSEGVSIVDVERAILLGSLRKSVTLQDHLRGTPVTTLHYFTSLFDEVLQNPSPDYWSYVTRKLRSFEQHWKPISTTPKQETK
jgi:hypothetical protein